MPPGPLTLSSTLSLKEDCRIPVGGDWKAWRELPTELCGEGVGRNGRSGGDGSDIVVGREQNTEPTSETEIEDMDTINDGMVMHFAEGKQFVPKETFEPDEMEDDSKTATGEDTPLDGDDYGLRILGLFVYVCVCFYANM